MFKVRTCVQVCFQIHFTKVIHDCRKLGVQQLKLNMMDNKLTHSSTNREKKREYRKREKRPKERPKERKKDKINE